MANILNKFLDFMKLGEDEDEYDEDFYVDEEESRPVTSVSSRRTSNDKKRTSSYDDKDTYSEPPKRERPARTERTTKLVPMQSGKKKEWQLQFRNQVHLKTVKLYAICL